MTESIFASPGRSQIPAQRTSFSGGVLISRGALLAACALASACKDDAAQTSPDAGVSIEFDAAPPATDASAPANGAARVCSSDAWCWAGAGPHGNTLFAVASSTTNNLWAVGELGLALQFDGETWVPRWAPTHENLRAVFARGNEVWAVGDNSTVLHHANDVWQAEGAPAEAPDTDLLGVTRDSDGHLWVVGARGTLLEQDGGTWSVVPTPVTTALNAIWSTGNDVWAVGEAGVVLRRGEEAWSPVDSGTNQNLSAVHGDADQVWIVGANGDVRYFDEEAARFQRPTGAGPAPAGNLRAVRVSGDSVHIANDDGNIYVWDAGKTCPVPGDAGAPEEPCPGWGPTRSTGRELPILGLWASGNRAVSVGTFGSIFEFDGARRTIVGAGSLDNYLAVSGTDAANVWVAGDRLLKLSAGASWTPIERDSARAMYSLHVLAEGETLVAGTGGMTRRLAGDSWESLDVTADAWLHDVWSDGSTGWLVGSRGRAWGLLNRRLWTELDTPTDQDLFAVWSSALGTAWAVGARGTTLRHDGELWAAIPSGPNGGVGNDLRGVWGSAENDIWAVGTAGMTLHWDGTRWSASETEATYSLNALWGRGASDIWAVGSGGTVLHYDGSAWQPEFSGTNQALHAVWGDGRKLWAVGEHGAILTKTLP